MTEPPPQLFDRALYAARIARAHRTGPDILSRTIAAEFAGRFELIARKFGKTVVIAPDPEPIAAVLGDSGKAAEVAVLEPSTDEHLPLAAESLDAVFSILDLQTINDVPGALVQMRRALRPDGLFLACLFAGDTLTELRQSWLEAEARLTGGASPRVAPMIDVRELGSLLQRAGFALPVADLDRTIVRYADAIALIHEIHALGLSNVLTGRSRRPVTKALLNEAAAIYQRRFADTDGRIRATVEVAWATAWAPHESQQQPLKPGSAKMRLADALKTGETKLTPKQRGGTDAIRTPCG